MSNIEDRVVQMKFDNAQFEKGIRTSMSSLEAFEKQIKNTENNKGFSALTDTIKSVTSELNVMKIAGITAIANITNSAVNAGKRLVSALTIDPVKTGLNEYELKMNSVQTILMGTGESLNTVMDALEDLNKYADRTIYSFQDMTSNIGKFTNAGVKLDVATSAIQGVSNLAALSGASAVEASRAMYNISQSLGTGYMQLMDWKSIENANMATMEFKRTLIETAHEMGVLNDASNVTAENLRETLQDKWLTKDVLLTTLQKYTDETTALGKKAFEAATQIKTASQLFDVMKESVQSGWAVTWENIFGNFNEAKQLFTEIGKIFDHFVSKSADSRNNLLSDWKQMGGRKYLIEGLFNTFYNLLNVLRPIKEAINEVFPATTAERLVEICRSFKEFSSRVWMSEKAASGLKKAVVLLLQPLKILVSVFKLIVTIMGVVAVGVWKVSQALLGLYDEIGGIGTILNAIFNNQIFKTTLVIIIGLLQLLVKTIIFVTSAVTTLFIALNETTFIKNIKAFVSWLISSGIPQFLERILLTIEKIKSIEFKIPKIDLSWFDKILSAKNNMNGFKDSAKSFGSTIKDVFVSKLAIVKNSIDEFIKRVTAIASTIKEVVSKVTPQAALVYMYGIVSIALMFKLIQLIDSFASVGISFTKTFKSINKAFNSFAFDEKSNAVIKLSVAFAMFAVTVKFLTQIPWQKLIIGGAALAVFGGEMALITVLLSKISFSFDAAKTIGIIMSLSAALLAISGAIKILETVKISKDIWKQLLVIFGLMATLTGAIIVLSKFAKGSSGMWIFLLAFTASLTQIVKLIGVIESMKLADPTQTIKLLVSIIMSLTLFMSLAKTNKIKLSSIAGLVLMSVSIDLVINAMKKIGKALGSGELDYINKLVEAGYKKLVKVLSSIKNALVSLKDSIAKDLGNILASNNREELIATITQTGAMFLMVSLAVSTAGFGIASLVKVLTGFVVKTINSLGHSIVKVAIACYVVVAAIRLLKDVDIDTIDVGIKAIQTILDRFMILVGVLGLFGGAIGSMAGEAGSAGGWFRSLTGTIKGTKKLAELGKNASKIGTAMIKFSIAIGLIVGAMKLMEYLDPEKMDRNLKAVNTLLIIFGIVSAMSAFSAKPASMFALSITTGILVSSLALLTLINDADLKRSTKALAIAFASISLMFATIHNMKISNSASAVISLAAVLVSIVGLTHLVKNMKDFDWEKGITAAKYFGLLAISLSSAVAILSKANFESIKDVFKNVGVFTGLVAAMGVLAVGLGHHGKEFFTIDPIGMASGMTGLIILTNGLASASLILSKANFGSAKDALKDIGVFASLATVMGVLAAGLGQYGKAFFAINPVSMATGVLGISILANGLAAATLVLSKAKFDSISSAAQSMAAFAAIAITMSIASNILAPAMIKISEIPIDKMFAVAGTISILAVAFSGATAILALSSKLINGSVANMLAASAGLIAIGATVRIIAPAIAELAKLPFKDAMLGLATLGTALVGLSVIAVSLGYFAKKAIIGAVAMVALSASLYVILPALERLSKLPFEETMLGLAALGTALVGLGVIGGVMGTFIGPMLLGAVAIAALSGSLYLLLPILERLSQIPFKDTMLGLAALGTALVGLGVVGGLMGVFVGPMLLGAVAIAALSASLYLILPILERLSQIPFKDTMLGLAALGTALVGLGVIGGIMGVLVGPMLLGAVAIAALSASVAVLGLALKVVYPPLNLLSTIDLLYLAKGLLALASGIGALGIVGLIGLPASIGITLLSGSLYLLAGAIKAIVAVVEGSGILKGLFEKMSEKIGGFVDGVSEKVGAMKDAVSDMASSFKESFDEKKEELLTAGAEWGDKIKEGFLSKKNEFKNSISDFVDGVTKGAEENETVLSKIGGWLGNAFNKGFRSKDGIDAHSPSLEAIRAMFDYFAGLFVGIDKNEETLSDKSEEIGETVVESTESGFSRFINKLADLFKTDKEKLEDSMIPDGDDLEKKADKSVKGLFNSFVDAFQSEDGNFLDKMRSGITSVFGKLTGAAEGSSIGEVFSNVFGLDAFDADNMVENIKDQFGDLTSSIGVDSEEISDSLEDMKDSLASSMDIFSRFDTQSKMSVDDLILAISSQVYGMDQFSNAIMELKNRGFDENLISQLASKGTSSMSQIRGLLEMGQLEIYAYNKFYERSLQSADQAIEKIKIAVPTLTKVISEETEKEIRMVGHAEDYIVDSEKNINNTVCATAVAFDKQKNTVAGIIDITSEFMDIKNAAAEAEANAGTSANNTANALQAQTNTMADGIQIANEYADSHQYIKDSLGNVYKYTYKTIEVTDDLITTFVANVSKLREEITTFQTDLKSTINGSINMFEHFDFTAELSAETMIDNMKSQLNALYYYNDSVEKLAARGLGMEALQEVMNKGVDGAFQYLAAYMSMTDQQLQEVNRLYTQKATLTEQAVTSITNSFMDLGMWTVQGYSDGIDENSAQILTQMTKLAAMSDQSFREVLGITDKTSSTKFKDSGAKSVAGYTEGINDPQANQNLTNAENNLANNIVSILDNSLNTGIFSVYGKNICDGVGQGIDNNSGSVLDKVNALANTIQARFQDALSIHSPSKVFESFGEYIIDGLVIGLRTGTGIVETATNDVAEASINRIKRTINELAWHVDDELDTTPVIRPVLDLSKIQNGATKLDGMFDKGIKVGLNNATQTANSFDSLRQSLGYNAIPVAQGGGNTYNFTQNNYSPKALSRIDIYRQTNNQFSQWKGLVENG